MGDRLKATNGVHLNLGRDHRFKRHCQEGVLPRGISIKLILADQPLAFILTGTHCSHDQ